MSDQGGHAAESANLDLLRATAVALVFCGHFYAIKTGRGAEWSYVWKVGRLGVLIFFVHTCLVLMQSLGRLASRGGAAGSVAASFYVRRAFRIYPLAIVCVLLALVFDAQWAHAGHADLLANLTLTQNLTLGAHRATVPNLVGPIWTLPLEVQMYVVLPSLFFFLRRRSAVWLCALWTLSLALACWNPTAELGESLLLLKFIPCFLGGVIAWRLQLSSVQPRLPGWLWPLAFAALSMIWFTANASRYALHLAAFGLALGLAIPLFREIPWAPVRRAAHVVARYSYGVYLSHFAIQVFVLSYPYNDDFRYLGPAKIWLGTAAPRSVRYGVLTLFVVVVPLIFYHLIEEPGIRLGRWVASTLDRRGARTALAPLPASEG